MPSRFPHYPWPTDDADLLDRALTEVLSTSEVSGHPSNKLIRDTAAGLILEAYNEGSRDAERLAVYALRGLRRRGPDL